jgi:pSer/pThr/pTyr-binding forkhead associated (FHA) protein
VTVGRTPNNDISIESPAISKLHAVFAIDAARGACALTDEGATNGTFVNGKRLQQGAATPLRDGDMVAFSQEYKFTYYTPGAFFDYLSVADRG